MRVSPGSAGFGAWSSLFQQYNRINVNGTVNLMEAIRREGETVASPPPGRFMVSLIMFHTASLMRSSLVPPTR